MPASHGDPDAFFLTCVGHFDEERLLFQKYISSVTPDHAELHMLDWDSRQRREDIEVAKLELAKAQKDVTRNSDLITRAKQAMEESQQARAARKKQIELLSELSQPVEHDVTYVGKDRHPHSTSTTANTNKFQDPEEIKKMVSRKYRTGEIVKLEQQLSEINSTIAKSTGALMLRIIELKATATKLERNNEGLIKRDYEEADALVAELEKLDSQSFSSVNEILTLRLNIMRSQREEVEETESERVCGPSRVWGAGEGGGVFSTGLCAFFARLPTSLMSHAKAARRELTSYLHI